MKQLSCLLLTGFLALFSCQQPTYQTQQHTDSNGYSYESVTNDPYNARIYTLDNGLKVYLTRNLDEPRVAALIGVKAGSTFEDPNATGLAHYMEHMMFKGTSKVGTVDWEKESALLEQISDLFEKHRATEDVEAKKAIYAQIDSLSQIAATYVATNEFDKLNTAMGSSRVNAGTSYESTVYMCEVPKNELERWAKLEHERFTGLVLRLFHTELETVYEEFNMYQDMDGQRAFQTMMEGLFTNHPYGRDVIGFPEHLKNPSMEEIYKFKDKFYIPNNMAIALAGDLDFEPTIQLIDQYFGKMEKKEFAEPQLPKEEPITAPVVKEVVGPDAESMQMAFRFNGIGSDDEIMVDLISSILSNGQAGLIDLDLVQKQKVLSASSGSWFMRDYGIHIFNGKPREGQTLEEVRDLLLAELDKVKNGEFEDWIIEAIVNKARLDFMNALEYPFYSAYSLMNEFTSGQSHADVLASLDKMKQITKEQVMAYAKEKYGDNYVIVYKRTGDNSALVKVDKPEITAVPVNRDLQSDFAQSFLAEEISDINPVFVDFNSKLHKEELKPGLEFFHSTNENNGLFRLNYVIDLGKNNNLQFPLAVDYLPLLGTDQYSPEDLRKELFRYGLSLSVNAGNDRCYVTIAGLDEKLEKGIELLEHIIHNAKAEQESYDEFVKGIVKKRSDAKKSQGRIFGAMVDYGIYGKKSPGKYLLSTDELTAINPEDLTRQLNEMTYYEHKVYYYGPSSAETVTALLNQHHKTPEQLAAIPEAIDYKMRENESSQVYVVDYDINQANILLLVKDTPFDAEIIPYAEVFNNYFGSGLSSVVFQEIRESKALAYSAGAGYVTARKADKDNFIYGRLGTQADKLSIATSTLTELMNEMPRAEMQFKQACEGIVKQINTERITNKDMFWEYLSNNDRGIDYDVRKDVYEKAKVISLDDFESFFNEHIKGKNYTYMVLGRKSDLDKKALSQLGKVNELALEDIFGY
ncbi:insulinase family protein [Carboxylicivirga sediminis]|uniref:Insulinase family protein n=1 Tax=Carboxylicivirga sediminis TaxID=2006564 RepID=A0A941IZB9_9BACT|nr:M16 family metallopeptidase [Carboxylicivirga sediminis]MBR8537343.1 insulinase family protein [Carboxylicivirga sediminis]